MDGSRVGVGIVGGTLIGSQGVPSLGRSAT